MILEHLCGITQLGPPKGGIYLTTPGETAAHGVFGLLAPGIENEPAAQLASKLYDDAEALKAALDEKVKPAQRPAVIKVLDAQIAPEAKPPPPIVPSAFDVASGHVGRYMHSEMELASGLWLKADGTFEYFLTVGSLDETAKGRRTTAGDRITLVNDPIPMPPTIAEGAVKLDQASGYRLQVVLPSARGVQGVDVTVGFDRGDPVDGYTQTEGSALPAGEKREPRRVQRSMSSYGLTSPRFPINVKQANAIIYTLRPNDIGVVDLRNAPVTVKGGVLSLDRQGQTMLFERRSGQADVGTGGRCRHRGIRIELVVMLVLFKAAARFEDLVPRRSDLRQQTGRGQALANPRSSDHSLYHRRRHHPVVGVHRPDVRHVCRHGLSLAMAHARQI